MNEVPTQPNDFDDNDPFLHQEIDLYDYIDARDAIEALKNSKEQDFMTLEEVRVKLRLKKTPEQLPEKLPGVKARTEDV